MKKYFLLALIFTFSINHCAQPRDDKSKENKDAVQYEQQRIYKCDFCNMAFDDEAMLLRHIRSQHEPQRVYKCDYCDKAFHMRGTLRQHMRHVHGYR